MATLKDVLNKINAVKKTRQITKAMNMVAASKLIAPNGGSTTLFVDVGPSMSEIDVICDQRLAFSRLAQVAVPTRQAEQPMPIDHASQEEAVGELAVEIMRSLQAYRVTDPSVRIDQIIIAGGTGLEEGLATRAAEQIGAPAHLFTPPLSLLADPRQDTQTGVTMGQIDVCETLRTLVDRPGRLAIGPDAIIGGPLQFQVVSFEEEPLRDTLVERQVPRPDVARHAVQQAVPGAQLADQEPEPGIVAP